MAALQYWLWLSSAGLSPRAKAALLERFGDAEALFHAPEGAFEGIPGVGRAEAAVLEKRDLMLKFRGSGNQRLLDLRATRASGRLTLWEG